MQVDYLADGRLKKVPFAELKKFIEESGVDQSELSLARTKFALVAVAEKHQVNISLLLDDIGPLSETKRSPSRALNVDAKGGDTGGSTSGSILSLVAVGESHGMEVSLMASDEVRLRMMTMQNALKEATAKCEQAEAGGWASERMRTLWLVARDGHGDTPTLNYEGAGWGDADLASLARELHIDACPMGTYLTLAGNGAITAGGFASAFDAPFAMGRLSGLARLDLRKCDGISALPSSIGACGLELLDLGMCSTLSSLPETLGMLDKLKTLSLLFCKALVSLPDSLGQLQRLATLELGFCTALASLPGSISGCTSLGHVSLAGCTGLRLLPDLSKSTATFDCGDAPFAQAWLRDGREVARLAK